MRLTLQVSALALAALSVSGCGAFHAADTQSQQAQMTLRVADAALASGAPEIALRVATVVLERQPGNVPAMVAKGDALYALGAKDQARDAYRSAVAADADSVGGQIGLGRTLVRSAPKEAETHFLAALAKQPDNVVALNNLGIARDLQGNHEQAQQAYRQALALNPDMADVKTNLGLSLALSGQAMQAVQVLQPIATAPDAGAMKHADLAVAVAQARDVGPTEPVKEQAVQEATAHYDTPIAISPAPVAAVESEPLMPKVLEQQAPLPAAQTVEHVIKPAAIVQAAKPETPTPATDPPRQQTEAPQNGIYVQMASLNTEQDAHTEWQHLRARWPDLLGERSPAVQQAEVHDRTFWRLRTGGFTSLADANDFCEKLRGAGAGCWTVGAAARN